MSQPNPHTSAESLRWRECRRAMAERMSYLLQVTDCSKPGPKTLEQIPSSSPGIAPTRGEDRLTVRAQFVAPVLAVERPPNVIIVSGDHAVWIYAVTSLGFPIIRAW